MGIFFFFNLGLGRDLRENSEEREEINGDRVGVGDISVVVSGFSSGCGWWVLRERSEREERRGDERRHIRERKKVRDKSVF